MSPYLLGGKALTPDEERLLVSFASATLNAQLLVQADSGDEEVAPAFTAAKALNLAEAMVCEIRRRAQGSVTPTVKDPGNVWNRMLMGPDEVNAWAGRIADFDEYRPILARFSDAEGPIARNDLLSDTALGIQEAHLDSLVDAGVLDANRYPVGAVPTHCFVLGRLDEIDEWIKGHREKFPDKAEMVRGMRRQHGNVPVPMCDLLKVAGIRPRDVYTLQRAGILVEALVFPLPPVDQRLGLRSRA